MNFIDIVIHTAHFENFLQRCLISLSLHHSKFDTNLKKCNQTATSKLKTNVAAAKGEVFSKTIILYFWQTFLNIGDFRLYSQFSSAAKIWKKSSSKRQKYHLTNVLKFIIIWFYQPNSLEDTRIHFPSTHVINLKLIYSIIWFVIDLSIVFKKIPFIKSSFFWDLESGHDELRLFPAKNQASHW